MNLQDTAYPRLKTTVSPAELAQIWTATAEERAWVTQAARGPVAQFGLLATLKCVQRLGYFVPLADLPRPVWDHLVQTIRPARIRDQLLRYDHGSTRWRHRSLIRAYLHLTPFDAPARHLAVRTRQDAVARREAVADLVNVAVEELVHHRVELPPFGVLWRAAWRIQAGYHRRQWQRMAARLAPADRIRLSALFEVVPTSRWSPWQRAKTAPGPPTARRFQAVWEHLQWLESWPLPETLLADVAVATRHQWATEARSLDAARMLALAEDKRWALTVAFLVDRAVQTRDDLAEMLIKRMQHLHKRGRDALAVHQQQHQTQADALIATFRDVLTAVQKADTPEGQIQAIAEVLGDQAAAIKDRCDAHLAHAGHNYYGFLPPLFRSQRATCFRLLNSLTIEATTQDDGLMRALRWLKTQAGARGPTLTVPEDFSWTWIPDRWWRGVTGQTRRDQPPRTVQRPAFECCAFSELAWALKSGDCYVVGSDQYADYRTQLISEDEYHANVATYGEQVGIAVDPTALVAQLRGRLAHQASLTDAGFPQNSWLRIEDGRPILTRLPAADAPAALKSLEAALADQMPAAALLDVLADTEYWLH